MSDPQLHPVVLFRTVAQGLPALPDSSLQAGTFVLITDALPPELWILQSPGGVQAWDPIGGAGALGLTFVVRDPIGTGAVQESAAPIPAGAVALYASVEIDTPYTGGTTMELGNAGAPDLLLATTDIDPTTPFVYDAVQPIAWGGTAHPLRLTVFGAPVVGAGFMCVTFGLPLS